MPDIDELSTITASLVPLDQRVRKAAFWAVYRGETPTDADLASRLGVPAVEIRGSVQRLLERGLITVDEARYREPWPVPATQRPPSDV